MADSIYEAPTPSVTIWQPVVWGNFGNVLFIWASNELAQNPDLQFFSTNGNFTLSYFWDKHIFVNPSNWIYKFGEMDTGNRTHTFWDDTNNRIHNMVSGHYRIETYPLGSYILWDFDTSWKIVKLWDVSSAGNDTLVTINDTTGLVSNVTDWTFDIRTFTGNDKYLQVDLTNKIVLLWDIDAASHSTVLTITDSTYLFTYTSGIIRGNAFHNNSNVSQWNTTQQDVRSGTYTPTSTSVTNVDSSTNYKAQWLRVWNVVTVSGKIWITPTAPWATTELHITLPVSSVFAAEQDCAWVAANGIDNLNGRVFADTSNSEAFFRFTSTGTSEVDFSYHFTYEVLAMT